MRRQRNDTQEQRPSRVRGIRLQVMPNRGCLATAIRMVIWVILSLHAIRFCAQEEKAEVYVQLGHAPSMSVDQPAIHALAISPDSQFAASGGEDGEIKLWRLGSGTEIRTFSGHSGRVLALAFSPDGLKILSGSADKTLKLWDVVSGREITTLSGHSSSVFAVAFTASGSRALSASSDTTLRLWDLMTGKQLKVFGECSKTTGTVAFSSDGGYALTGSLDPVPKPFAQFAMGGKDIRVWEVATGREVHRFGGKAYNVSAVAISADNKYVAVGNFNQTVTVWNNITGEAILILHGRSKTPVEGWRQPTLIPLSVDMDRPDGVLALSFSPDGRYLVGSVDRTLNIWEITTGKLIKTIVADDVRIVTITYSPDGRLLVVGGGDPQIKVWNAATGQLHTKLEGMAVGIEHISVSPDGSFVIAGTRERLWIWDLVHGKLIGTISGYRGALRGMAVLPDGKRVVSATGDNSIRVFSLASGTSILNFKNRPSDLWSVSLSPGADRILIGTLEGATSVWDLSRQTETRNLPGSQIVDDIVFTPDGRYALIGYSHMRYKHGTEGSAFIDSGGNGLMDVAAAEMLGWKYSKSEGSDNSTQDVRLWDLDTGKIIRNFDKDDKGDRGVTSVAVSRNKTYVVAGDRNGTITVWNFLTGTVSHTLRGHSDSIVAIALSADSKTLASASYDKTVRLWDLATGDCVSILRGHTGSVTAVAFTPDDRRIISGSSDGTTRVWDANTGKETTEFIGIGRDDWLIMTPEGYYNSSEKGAHFVNVRIGTEIHTMDQFYDAFYHPDLLEAKLQDQSLLTHPSVFTINQTLHSPPPRVSISSPADNSTSTEQFIEIKTRIEDEGGGIGEVRIYHNGKLINSDKPSGVAREAGGQTSAERRSVERKFSVDLVHGNNTVTIIAFNSQNTVMSASKTISVWGDVPLRPPALFVLAVGNAHFTKRAMNLRRPIDDAQDVAELFRTSFSFAFREVTVKTLTDITKPQMAATIRQMTTTIRPEDVFVLFLATHGKTSNDVYYAYMSDFGGDIRSQSSSLSSLELMQISKTIPALRQLFIFDTCEAGGVEPLVSGLYDTRISVLAHSAGLHVFAGSKTFQDAQDDFEGNGLFTHFLLAGLRGLADTEGAGNVTVHELGSFLAKTVTGASLGRQQPFIRSFGEDFPLTTTSSSLALFRPAPSGASTQKRPAGRRTDTMEDSRGGERISEITLLVGSAKRLYELAHFRQALQICERVLSLDPQNREAIELRKRVLETMRVLGETY